MGEEGGFRRGLVMGEKCSREGRMGVESSRAEQSREGGESLAWNFGWQLSFVSSDGLG